MIKVFFLLFLGAGAFFLYRVSQDGLPFAIKEEKVKISNTEKVITNEAEKVTTPNLIEDEVTNTFGNEMGIAGIWGIGDDIRVVRLDGVDIGIGEEIKPGVILEAVNHRGMRVRGAAGPRVVRFVFTRLLMSQNTQVGYASKNAEKSEPFGLTQ